MKSANLEAMVDMRPCLDVVFDQDSESGVRIAVALLDQKL